MIFVSGATGYLGSRLIGRLVEGGADVRALCRRPADLPCQIVRGDPLDASTYAESVRGCEAFVHLVGVPHPAPWKEAQFRAVDLRSVREAVMAAKAAGVSHFVYVSVAHPAPTMKAYIRVREECEGAIAEAGLKATILRPWYVLGPGHRWPVALKPFYWIAEHMPSTRETALRLGLVTIDQMLGALVRSLSIGPPSGLRVWPVPEIRSAASTARSAAARQ
jgi:uncharacterized protein YbjT (DUF2867 family)